MVRRRLHVGVFIAHAEQQVVRLAAQLTLEGELHIGRRHVFVDGVEVTPDRVVGQRAVRRTAAGIPDGIAIGERPLSELRGIGSVGTGRGRTRVEVIEQAHEAVRRELLRQALAGRQARVARTPVAHVHLVVRRALMGLHLAHVDAELEATEVEVQMAVQTDFVDLAFLLLHVDAHDLRAEVICVERVGVIATRTAIGSRLVREYPARRDWQVTREVVFLGDETRALRHISRRRAGLPSLSVSSASMKPRSAPVPWHSGTPAKLKAVALPPVTGSFGREFACELCIVERQAEVVGHFPVGIEADRVELVLLLVALLLVAEVLVAVTIGGHLEDVLRGRNIAAGVEMDFVEGGALLGPHGLLAAILRELVARHRVVDREGQTIGGGELQ